MICKNCNAFIEDDSVFCPSCGQKAEAEPAAAAAPASPTAFHHAGSLDGGSGIGAPVVEKKPAAPQDAGLRFSSSFGREGGASVPYGSKSAHTEAPVAMSSGYSAPHAAAPTYAAAPSAAAPSAAAPTYTAAPSAAAPTRAAAPAYAAAPYTAAPTYAAAPNASAPYAAAAQQPAYQANGYNPYGQPYIVNNVVVNNAAPVGQLKTNKKLWKYWLFGLLTFGIYQLVVMSSVSESTNIVASRYDGKKTMHYCLLLFLIAPLTLGIASFVWFHRVSNRIGGELQRRRIAYSLSASDYWLWNILGSLILVGPFIYMHKLFKATNLMCEHYNHNG